MIPTKEFIRQLIKERANYARVFDIEGSRTVYNPLIKYHIKGYRENLHTLRTN